MIVATTERLILRDLEERDAGNVLLLNSDPEVLKHVHDVPFANAESARLWISNIHQQIPHGSGRYAIETHEGMWIGRCSLRRSTPEETLMGYRLLREHWGKGYATEAARAMLDLAFSAFGLDHVICKVARQNRASQRVMEKSGGRFWKVGSATNFADALIYRFDRP